MKILHVITSLHTGGAEKLMVDLIPRQIESGLEVSLCVFNGEKTPFHHQLEEKGVRIIALSHKPSYYNPVHIYRLWRLMCDYDVIHTHNTAPQLFAAVASVFRHKPLVTTEHSTSNRRRGSKLLQFVDMWMYSHYKHVICISEGTKENLKDSINTCPPEISVCYNGIDVKKYADAKPIGRTPFVRNSDSTIITMVSGFRYQKDHETVIRALALLPDNFELWFVGDGERRALIEEEISKYNLKDRVHLLGIRSDIPSILKASDIVVQSSHIEGFGLAAVEGMAAGKPVVASNIVGISQVVEGAGILFPHGDDKTLASIIQRLSEDKAYYRQVAEKCWERAQMYDIQKMVDSYSDLYKSLYS